MALSPRTVLEEQFFAMRDYTPSGDLSVGQLDWLKVTAGALLNGGIGQHRHQIAIILNHRREPESDDDDGFDWNVLGDEWRQKAELIMNETNPRNYRNQNGRY